MLLVRKFTNSMLSVPATGAELKVSVVPPMV
jgi:hypothetical protein